MMEMEQVYPINTESILKITRRYNAKQFFEMTEDKPETERYELIDGKVYVMSAPSVNHHRIIRKLSRKLDDYFDGRVCEPFFAPVDVVLFDKKDEDKSDEENEENSQNVFQPDIFVVCDPDKVSDKRIYGPPDFIIEVVSPSNSENDYIKKLYLYMQYGVREYWIADPQTEKIFVYVKDGEAEMKADVFTFDDKIKSGIFQDLEIDFKSLVNI